MLGHRSRDILFVGNDATLFFFFGIRFIDRRFHILSPSFTDEDRWFFYIRV